MDPDSYVYQDGQLVAQRNGAGSKIFIHGNHEGSSSVITRILHLRRRLAEEDLEGQRELIGLGHHLNRKTPG